MHHQQPSYSFSLAFSGIENIGTGTELSRVNPKKAEFTDIRVGHNLKCQCRDGSSSLACLSISVSPSTDRAEYEENEYCAYRYAGAGKSTIGVLLAKAMKMPFIDTDLLIQQKYNKYLQEIIDEVGVKEFLSIEEKTALELNVENHVIATGGSMIYSNLALEHLKKMVCLFIYS